MRNVYAAVVMVLGFVMVSQVHAQDEEVSVESQNVESKIQHHHQFLSKRPYHAPVVVASRPASEQGWEGASMTVGQEQKEKHLQLLRMHSIGKRPF